MSLSWYRDQGVFKELQFRRLVDRIDRPLPPDAQIVTAFTDGQVTLRSNRDKIGYHEASDLSSFQGVKAGDLVVHGLDILRGSVGVSDSVGAISAVCTVSAPRDFMDGRFIAYAIRAQAQSGFTRALARGIREGGADFRRWDTLAELPIPVPPIEEQRRIADFLDDQVTRIDQAIALRAKQSKAGLGFHRGLLVHVGHLAGFDRPSPIPWFPCWGHDWQCKPLKAVGRCLDAQRVPLSAVEREGKMGKYPYYGASTIVDYVDDYLFEGSYLLVGEDGASLENPDFDVVQEVDGRFWVNNHAHILESIGVERSYLALYLRSVDRPVFVSGATRPKITQDDLMHLKVPVPPLEVQQKLVLSAQAVAAKWQSAMTQIENSARELEERKRALITSAVTGGIDVTNARPIMSAHASTVGVGAERRYGQRDG